MRQFPFRSLMPIGCMLLTCSFSLAADHIDLQTAVVVHPADRGTVEQSAVEILTQEIERRSGLRWKSDTIVPQDQAVVVVATQKTLPQLPITAPEQAIRPFAPEGYCIVSEPDRRQVWIIGADDSGAVYGVGRFLRLMDWKQHHISFPAGIKIQTAPQYPIRGHQLGYRSTANSYDAWSAEQYEQYIRELTFFGTNAIENIPLWERTSPLMPVTEAKMHAEMSNICRRYGLQYWVWVPALADLENEAERSELLDVFERMFKGCSHLTGAFVPGGDPGDHDPQLMLPFLKDAAQRLNKHHPNARMWMSMQGFSRAKAQVVYDLLHSEHPDWLGGIVAGPSSRPIPELRNNIPMHYPIRLYPDITHNKICQYPVPWWDMAYALTLGREAINPRPVQYAQIHNWFAPYSDGFIAYSDGAHDDVNKVLWSALGWDSQSDIRDVVNDYTHVFFSTEVADQAADGIFALERNWRGPLRYNASVENTLTQWTSLDEQSPELIDNWRWQMCLLRANYDAFVRQRLLKEESLEEQANAALRTSAEFGSEASMERALQILNQAVTQPVAPKLRARIVDLCTKLNQSIGLQTSVPLHQASNPERGAILDFVDIPLNNRWWLEDEFDKVRSLDSEAIRVDRLLTIANWESPGHGSFYDDIGHPAKSAHVRHSEQVVTIHGEEALPEPLLWWMGHVGGKSRLRHSSLSSMDYPEAVVYEGLDPQAKYVVRCGGLGQFHLRVDGDLIDIEHERAELGDTRDFPVPQASIVDRRIELTWDRPEGEGHLNWRQRSRLCEVWLLKQPTP